jgi:hypothetical protein
MTSPHQDPAEDAAFEEFLQGRGELVKQLKAMSQMTPSAALDAAILASARNAIEQEKRVKQAAANDPVAPRQKGFMPRLRIPRGMAASLMVAVLVTVLWHAQPVLQGSVGPDQAPQSPSVAPAFEAAGTAKSMATADTSNAQPAASSPQTQAQAVAQNKPAAVPAAKQSDTAMESRAQTTEKKAAAPAVPSVTPSHEAASPTTRQAELKPAAPQLPSPQLHAEAVPAPAKPLVAQSQGTATVPAPAPVTAYAAAPAAANAPAKAPAASNPATDSLKAAAAPPPAPAPAPTSASAPAKAQTAGAPGAESLKAAAVPAAAPKAEAPAKSEPQDKQKAWLAHIEELIRAGSRQEAAAEWDKFEKANPGYPVPEQLKAQMQALKKN